MIQAVASAMGEVYVPLYKLQVGREATTSLCPVWPPASYPNLSKVELCDHHELISLQACPVLVQCMDV